MVGFLLAADTSDNSNFKRQLLIMGPRGHKDIDEKLPPRSQSFYIRRKCRCLSPPEGQIKAQRDTYVEDVRVPLEAPSARTGDNPENSGPQSTGEQPTVEEWDLGFRFKGAEHVPHPFPAAARGPDAQPGPLTEEEASEESDVSGSEGLSPPAVSSPPRAGHGIPDPMEIVEDPAPL